MDYLHWKVDFTKFQNPGEHTSVQNLGQVAPVYTGLS